MSTRIETVEAAIEDFREALYSEISDCSKEVNGFRMRYNFDDKSTAELIALADHWWSRASESAEEERVELEVAGRMFESLVRQVIADGASDRATAIRWLKDAEGDDLTVGHMEWMYGLKEGYLLRVA